MSNPGVLTLTEKKIGLKNTFRVEDNLGEAIHIHYNNIRIDLTVRELYQIADICDETIYDLIKVTDFDLDDYDGDFLVKYSKQLIDLQAVKKEKVKAGSLCYLKKEQGKLPARKPISACAVGDDPFKDDCLPVLFNDDNALVYGAEKAAALYAKDPEAEIEVIRLYFENNGHNVPKNPTADYLFNWNKDRIAKTGYKMAKKVFKKK